MLDDPDVFDCFFLNLSRAVRKVAKQHNETHQNIVITERSVSVYLLFMSPHPLQKVNSSSLEDTSSKIFLGNVR